MSLLYIPNDDPRKHVKEQEGGQHIWRSHWFNAFHYTDCWHMKLAIYRFARALSAEDCACTSWLSTPTEIHHMAVEIEFNFPHDELGTPREFWDTIKDKKLSQAESLNDYSSHKTGKYHPVVTEITMKTYERDKFLLDMNNVNKSDNGLSGTQSHDNLHQSEEFTFPVE